MSHRVRYSILSTLCLTAGLMCCGCAGYQVGTATLYQPDIRTVYVPMFQSDSLRRGLGERLTEAVVKEVELKTPYKVVGDPNADSVLNGRILKATKRVIAENSFDEAINLEIGFRVQISWIDRRHLRNACGPFAADGESDRGSGARRGAVRGHLPTTGDPASGRTDSFPDGSTLVAIVRRGCENGQA